MSIFRNKAIPYRKQRLLFLFAALCALCGGIFCAWANESFPIEDSGYFGRTSGAQDIYWLDDYRLIFIGQKRGEFRDEDGHKLPRTDLFVWHTRTGVVQRHAELSTNSSLCSNQDYVRYYFDRNGTRYVRFGEMGREIERQDEVLHISNKTAVLNPVSCLEYDPQSLKVKYGVNPLPLLGPGEYLDRTLGRDLEQIRYFPSNDRDPIVLREIPAQEVVTTPEYSAFTGTYVFQELRTRMGAESTHRIWLLDSSGAVRGITIPAGPWMGGNVYGMPSAQGWIFATSALTIGQGVGGAGIYLLREEKPKRLIAGLPYSFAVSPNGCKVATSIDTERKEFRRSRIMLIDVCSEGG